MRCVTSVAVIAFGALLWASGDVRLGAQQDKPSANNKPATVTAQTAAWPVKLKDGQPDVQGVWEPKAGNSGRPSKGWVTDPPDGRIPYLPWARVRRDEVKNHHLDPNAAQVDTRTRGWPDGVPRLSFYRPFQIFQPSGAVLMLYEVQHEFRYIPLDGRPLLDDGVKLWMGSSRGHWEGTTLVVEVRNISDQVRFSVVGDFASDEVHITERWKFIDRDTVDLSATFDDPKVYARPWTAQQTLKRVNDPSFEAFEYAGVEEDKDSSLMVDIPSKVQEKK